MSVFFEGNAFIDGGQLQNANVTLCTVSNCAITTSSLDMALQNITSVKDPIQPQDAATKKFVDDLGIVIKKFRLEGIDFTDTGSSEFGTYIISVKPEDPNGPTAIFNVSKMSPSSPAHIVRTVATPGLAPPDDRAMLLLKWDPNENIMIRKTHSTFNGIYIIKIM